MVQIPMQFYPSENKNEIMKLAGNWKELENTVLSKRAQVQKTKDLFVSFVQTLCFYFYMCTLCGSECRAQEARKGPVRGGKGVCEGV